MIEKILNKKAQEEKISGRNFSKLSGKSGQEEKNRKFFALTSCRGQEEIIGFGIILLVIAVIFLVFLSFSNNKNNEENLDDFKTTSFTKALMELTTTCEKNSDFVSVKDLIFECGKKAECSNEEDSCGILEETIENSMSASWNVNANSSVKGYEIVINLEGENLINITGENFTSGDNFKGATQKYSKSGDDAEIFVKIYT